MTEWRPIPGFEGRYAISDDGRVMALAAPGRGRLNADRILKLGKTTTGYTQVLLYPGNGAKSVAVRVHRLVLEVFVGPPPPGAYALHNDDDRTNNHVTNLRWGTPSENAVDQVRNGVHNHGRKTHCKWGHEFSGDNLVATERQRSCRACARRRNAEYQDRKRGALAVYVADRACGERAA